MSTKKYKYCLEFRSSIEYDDCLYQPFGFQHNSYVERYYGNNKEKLISYSKELKRQCEQVGLTFDFAFVWKLED